MPDLAIRRDRHAGHITLTRPQALNALTHPMARAIETALDRWRDDDRVALVILDAEGERAFCAGGDIAQIYHAGRAGDPEVGRRFWRDEYRLNAKLAAYPKPIISFLHGFTLGGGVGLGCHLSHRIVGESVMISMPECGIGFVPDVGGSYLLAQAPGRLGNYIALTTARMGAGDALFAGFADHFVPEADWPALKDRLAQTGAAEIPPHPTPDSPLQAQAAWIDATFAGDTLEAAQAALDTATGPLTEATQKAVSRNDPLAMATTLEMLRRLRTAGASLPDALRQEYRVSHRIQDEADFLEGVRAAVIDKDRRPRWQFGADPHRVAALLAPLGDQELTFEETTMTIAFIGLGNMGAPMAANLAAAGHAVTGFDLSAPMPEGVAPAETAAEAVKGADVVITMLPNGQILRAVAAEVIPAMAPGAVLLDCSTVDVDSARAVAAQATEAGLAALDAPVSGGIGGAAAGTLTFMVGGTAEAFATAKPLFDIMGQKAVHCGEAGNGQAAKICNNMILGVTMIATCEAFALADKLGLSRQAMFDVVSTSSGYSWSMNAYCPAPGVGPTSPADNGYTPGFAAELMLKDLTLAQQAAASADADTPLGAAAKALYQQFVEVEDGQGRDFSAMLPRFEKRGHKSGDKT